MNENEMIKDKEQMARIIAFELCPYKYHKEWWGENAKCYSDNNFAHCPRVKEVVDKIYNANYRKVGEDEIVIKKSEYKELKKYRTDWLNSEKMHLQAELEDTEFELGCSNRLFQKVCEEKKELEKQLEQAKQETAMEILQEILYTKSCEEWFENEQLVDFGKKIVDKIENLANKYGIELE